MDCGNVVQSLDRALAILEELSRQNEGLGVTELGYVLGLHKSTVHRLLHTLMLRGYVEKINGDNYRLGLKLVELGQVRLESAEIREEAKPFLNELMESTNETVHLCVLEGGEIVYIDKVESSNTVRMYSRIGLRVPAHCTGVGKAILAYLPKEEVLKIAREKGMPYKTVMTITNIESMMSHFETIRDRGYAVDDEEHQLGIRCIAAPVWNHIGKVVASISVSGPSSRITADKVEEISEKVKNAALKISKRLGHK